MWIVGKAAAVASDAGGWPWAAVEQVDHTLARQVAAMASMSRLTNGPGSATDHGPVNEVAVSQPS